jgi:hypothetical protein
MLTPVIKSINWPAASTVQSLLFHFSDFWKSAILCCSHGNDTTEACLRWHNFTGRSLDVFDDGLSIYL